MAQLHVNELITRLQSVKFTLEQEAQNIVAVAAMDLKGLSETNVLLSGVGMYSVKKIPTYWFRGKELNRRGSDYLADNKTGNWGEFRKAQGLQVAYVDLFYSGHMWHNMGVIRIEKVGTKLIAYLGGQDKKAADHMYYMMQLYGPFVTNSVTRDDIVFINNNAQATLTGLLKQVGV
jgi:hypothetical protein